VNATRLRGIFFAARQPWHIEAKHERYPPQSIKRPPVAVKRLNSSGFFAYSRQKIIHFVA
jgi:hypothetical protein